MSRSKSLCAAFAITAAALAAGGQPASADTRELFIGNSLTFSNDLPGLVGQMRWVSGAPMDYFQNSSTMFGVGLDWHWADTRPQGAHALLAPGGWDGVVLQDLSVDPTDAPNRTRTYVRLWNDEIKQKSPDATTYLFAHWERQDRPGSTPIIENVYGSLGAELDATVVPVGRAWKRLAASRPDIPLYIDVVHPTPAGSYIAAATFYASFYGQSPVGFAPPQGINPVDALAMQNAAWDVVSGRPTAQDRNWTASGSGDWNDSENWGPPGVPAAGDRLTISANDGVDRAINYTTQSGASVLLGSLNISAANAALSVQQSQSTLRLAGNLVLGDAGGGRGSYVLSGTGRIFAARDERIVHGAFIQHGGRQTVMQRLVVGGESNREASYLLDGGLLAANSIQVAPGGTFTQNGGVLDSGQFDLVGGTVRGVLRNRGVFEYSSGRFEGKLVNEGTATLAFNPGKVIAAEANLPQMEIEVAGTGDSVVIANANQDLKSLIVNFANEGTQGFDLASGTGDGQFRLVRLYPGDAAAVNSAARQLGAAIGNALANPGDGIYDSGLEGRLGTRIGVARRLDGDQTPFLLMRPTVVGDLNLDGAVTIADFIDLAASFQATDATWDIGDVNYDGSVTIADFIDLAANFGRDYSGEAAPISIDDQKQLGAFAASQVPEPGGLLWLGLLVVGMRRLSRHQQR